MTLPPVIPLPLPKAKPAQRRTNVGRIFRSGSTSATNDIDETDETEEGSGVGSQVRPVAGRSGKDGSSEDDDLPKRKPQSPTGLLSDNTLRNLLLVQEQASAADDTTSGRN